MTISLGIDLGTSKVAVVVVDSATRDLLGSTSKLSEAEIPAPAGFSEQDADKIASLVDECVRSLPAELREKVQTIGLTGQMHGVVLWESSTGRTSRLVTWQDGRCNQGDFLPSLAAKTGDSSLRSGFGCATLAWYAKNEPAVFSTYDCAATIHDYLACRMCGIRKGITDHSDAASFGYFDIRKGRWIVDRTAAAGIPDRLLPDIKPVGSKAGTLTEEYSRRWGIPAGTSVMIPVGDNQASLFSTLSSQTDDIGLTLGTGGQVAVVIENESKIPGALPPTVEIRPYVGESFAAVSASLCGGSAWKWLPETIESWLKELDITAPSREDIYRRLVSLGLQSGGSTLTVTPSFRGERHDINLRGTIEGIDLENFSLSNLSLALASGIVTNLKSMLPQELLLGRKQVVCSGNAVRRSLLMQRQIGALFNLPVKLSTTVEEAAQGAALLSAAMK